MKLLSKFKKSINKKYKYLRASLFKGKKILVLSDSHGGVFEYIFDNDLFKPHLINVEIVGGATAYGLNKENSQTGSFNRYKNVVEKFKDFKTILIQLGEVDASFIIWKKIEKGLDRKQAIDLSLSGYKKLLEYLIDEDKDIIILGAILPTLKDNQEADESALLRNTISATQKERTQLILQYNEELQKLAQEYHLKYIDITKETISNKNIIDDKFINKSVADHHQCFQATSPLWVEKLKQII